MENTIQQTPEQEKEKIHVTMDNVDDSAKNKFDKKKKKSNKFWFFQTPYDRDLFRISSIVSGCLFFAALATYIVLGVVKHLWSKTWMIFLFIPVVSSIFTCVGKKRFSSFMIIFLVTGLYCALGMNLSHFWHPGWAMFFAVPLYHIPAWYIDKYRMKKHVKEFVEEVTKEAEEKTV